MQVGNYRFDQELALLVGEKAATALIVLVITWALAKAAKWAFAKLVDSIGFLQRSTSSGDSIGMALGKVVSGVVWIFGLIVILNVLDLGGENGPVAPLQTLLNNIMAFLPKLIGAGLIFFIGLMVARIVRDVVVTALETVDLDKWANRGGVGEVTGNNAISKTIGTIIFVLIIIPVSIAALGELNIQTISGPATNMLQLIFDAIPRIIGAAILLGLGFVISRFVVQIAKEILPGLGVDRAVESIGILPEGTSMSDVIARVLQATIMIVVAIAATRLLGFAELTAILNEVLALGGKVVFGAVVIGAGFLIANLLARLIAGTDQASMVGSVIRWATIALFTFMGLRFMGVAPQIVDMAFGAVVIGGSVAGALAFGLGGRDWAARKLEQLDSTTTKKK